MLKDQKTGLEVFTVEEEPRTRKSWNNSLHVVDVSNAEPSVLWHLGIFSSTAEV